MTSDSKNQDKQNQNNDNQPVTPPATHSGAPNRELEIKVKRNPEDKDADRKSVV